MQGVVLSYDPTTHEGIVVCDTDRATLVLAPDALGRSILQFLRQGQRVVFEIDGAGRATGIKLGSEVDMGLPPDVQV